MTFENGSVTRRTFFYISLVATISVFFFTRLTELGRYPLTFDEVFTANAVLGSWHDMMQIVVHDAVHPPLFYILLKAWTIFAGHSIVALRALPCLFALLLLFPLSALMNEFKLPNSAQYVALMMASFSHMLIFYAQEVRMYSLLSLLCTTSLWLFYKFLRQSYNKMTLAALFATNLVMVYTHYYGFLYLGAEIVMLGVFWLQLEPCYRDTSRFSILIHQMFAVGLLFLPWFMLVHKAAVAKGGVKENLDWILPPTKADIASFYAIMTGVLPVKHSIIISLVFVGLLIILGYSPFWKHELSGMAVMAIFPVALAAAASYALPYSVFGFRYLIGCVVPWIMLVAISIASVPDKKKCVIVCIVVLWVGLAGVYFVTTPGKKIPWKETKLFPSVADRNCAGMALAQNARAVTEERCNEN